MTGMKIIQRHHSVHTGNNLRDCFRCGWKENTVPVSQTQNVEGDALTHLTLFARVWKWRMSKCQHSKTHREIYKSINKMAKIDDYLTYNSHWYFKSI